MKRENLGSFLAIALLITVGVGIIIFTINSGNEHVKKIHTTLTTNKTFTEQLTCNDLKGNETLINNTWLFDVKQIEKDTKNLELEKGCR